MTTVTVRASRPYEVTIGRGLLDTVGRQAAGQWKGRSAAVVSDSTVAPLYLNRVKDSLERAGFQVHSFVFPAGEDQKNGGTYLKLLEFLAARRLTRADGLIALGGGVVGDLAGFAAATFLRGIGFLQLPTTLLAAVDSSVGGKTAIDLTNGKNLAGAFYQPQAVLCDLDTLDTLPAEVFADGCAEVIKYGMIGDPALLARLETVDFRADPEELVARCVAQKRNLVEQDEFDTGARQLLNLGHTLGHGVEACSGYTVSHGRAVAHWHDPGHPGGSRLWQVPRPRCCPACGGCWSGMACRTPPPIRPRRCMRKLCRTKSGPETPFLWWYPLPGAPASWCGFPCQSCRRG